MIASLLRLFALRPLFTVAILGVPLIALIAIGVVAVLFVKALVFIVLPIAVGIWLLRKLVGTRPSAGGAAAA